MLKKVVLASKNQGKIKEIETILSGLPVQILSLALFPNIPDVEEDGASFFENAFKKAKVVSELTNEMALADDSGLEVEYLKGEPGIYSARYAGNGASDEENMAKLLASMEGAAEEQRAAAFRCVIVLYEPDGQYHAFEGRWTGRISEVPRGKGGFGYDPVFLLPEKGLTAAELRTQEKNCLSHRAQALQALRKYMQKDIP